MRDLTYSERVKLTKLIQEIASKKYEGEALDKLHVEAIKLVHGNSGEIDLWYKEKTYENIRKLNRVVDDLNRYVNNQLKAEKMIISAASKLLSDFEGAEADAKQAIRLASGDPKKYDTYEKEVKEYFESELSKEINLRKKSGEKVDHPKEILDKQQFIKDAKNIVNTIANTLMVTSPEFRENRVAYIKHSLENSKYNAKFIDRDGQMQFRTIRPEGDYGKPEVAFKEGLAPQFVSMWAFQSGVISKPYVNDVFETEGEKIGWSGGITSTSANLKFCAAFDFAASYGMQDGYIYVYACDEAASVGRHISFGVGYDGKVDKGMGIERSNAEAAMEYMLPFLSPERIIGAREIKKDGSLGEFFPNPNVKQSAYGDTEFLKLVLCENVNEIKLIEYLERRSVEILHKDNDLEYTNKMVKLFSELAPERQAVVLKIAHASHIALTHQLTENLDPTLKETDPLKWDMLHGLKLSKDPEHPIEVLPEVMKLALSHEQQSTLDTHLEKHSKLQVKSHFGFEFERDKRTTKDKSSTEKVHYPQPRFFRQQQEQPTTQDTLEEISKITPQNPHGSK
ncbi:hypothetical protein Lsan_2747 [Legionella santicrucis]|uniref:Uncharacterized protein n=1 Tax=Legionella santicrucis TaxID=45074 RepID=A0A0W0YID2_9GAMM|nr:hypothetical protein [Legionella santicrucis]KTD56587.1 hypothetical protein Lsan_2747 [Legionella santicrucis]